MITQEELKKLLHYNPDTGVFTCLKTGAQKGIISDGYVRIQIKDKLHSGHRLAWLYEYGYFPENEVDHINHIRHDNRLENLRELSRACNARNSGNYANNTSGVRGVSWIKSRNSWAVFIRHDGRDYCIKRCKCFIEAVCHRLAAEQCLGWDKCNNSSPAYQYVKNKIDKAKASK
jgi:hypothetical protein